MVVTDINEVDIMVAEQEMIGMAAATVDTTTIATVKNKKRDSRQGGEDRQYHSGYKQDHSRPDHTPQLPNMNVDRPRNNEGGAASTLK